MRLHRLVWVYTCQNATLLKFHVTAHIVYSYCLTGKNIDMTAPVVTKVIPGKGPNSESTFIVSFFIPPSHHSEPPSPSNPDVYIEEFPDLTVYTIAFSGFAKDKDFNEEAAISTDKTKEKSVHEEFYYTAGYDSPMKLINRTNEVWFVMKE